MTSSRFASPWLALIALVLGLLLGGCSKRGDEGSGGLAERVAALESGMKAQAAKHAEERQLLIQALQASTTRLDDLVRRVNGDPASSPAGSPSGRPPQGEPAGGSPTPEPATASGDGAADAIPTTVVPALIDRIDFGQTAIIFLSVSLFLLVAFVVFAPGRLRTDVPQVEYSAETPVVGELPELAAPVVPVAATEAAAPSRPKSFPDPEVVDGSPVPHKLSLRLANQDSLEDLVELLDSYLNTEPYILRNPAPRVALVQGQLHLQFYALPNLSQAEHALLDATVRRLTPRATEDAPAA